MKVTRVDLSETQAVTERLEASQAVGQELADRAAAAVESLTGSEK